MFSRMLVLIAGLTLTMSGCKEKELPMPKTYPVTGKVLYKDGKPMKKGMITFKPVGDDSASANSIVEEDGSFTLQTLTQTKQKAPGAVEGEHRVTLIFMVDDQMSGRPPDPLTLAQTYKVLPQDNNYIEIKIDKLKSP